MHSNRSCSGGSPKLTFNGVNMSFLLQSESDHKLRGLTLEEKRIVVRRDLWEQLKYRRNVTPSPDSESSDERRHQKNRKKRKTDERRHQKFAHQKNRKKRKTDERRHQKNRKKRKKRKKRKTDSSDSSSDERSHGKKKSGSKRGRHSDSDDKKKKKRKKRGKKSRKRKTSPDTKKRRHSLQTSGAVIPRIPLRMSEDVGRRIGRKGRPILSEVIARRRADPLRREEDIAIQMTGRKERKKGRISRKRKTSPDTKKRRHSLQTSGCASAKGFCSQSVARNIGDGKEV